MPYDGETLRERHRRVRAFVIASDRHRADFETRVARLGDDLKAEKNCEGADQNPRAPLGRGVSDGPVSQAISLSGGLAKFS